MTLIHTRGGSRVPNVLAYRTATAQRAGDRPIRRSHGVWKAFDPVESADLADRERYVAMSLAARKAHEEKYNYETVFQPVLERILAMTGPASVRE